MQLLKSTRSTRLYIYRMSLKMFFSAFLFLRMAASCAHIERGQEEGGGLLSSTAWAVNINYFNEILDRVPLPLGL